MTGEYRRFLGLRATRPLLLRTPSPAWTMREMRVTLHAVGKCVWSCAVKPRLISSKSGPLLPAWYRPISRHCVARVRGAKDHFTEKEYM